MSPSDPQTGSFGVLIVGHDLGQLAEIALFCRFFAISLCIVAAGFDAANRRKISQNYGKGNKLTITLMLFYLTNARYHRPSNVEFLQHLKY